MAYLLAQAEYETVTDVVILPLILLFFGALFYFLGLRKSWIGEKATWRWIGFGIMVLAALAGFRPFWNMVSPGAEGDLYRGLYTSRKIIWGHYFGFLAPLGVILLGLVIEFLHKRQKKYEY